MLRGVAILFYAILMVGAQTRANAQEPSFYAGKRPTMLINFAPGGATDIEGRFMARHLQRHLPSKPTIVVQNMDGGAGLVGMNYLGEVAARDGTMFGYLSGAAWQSVADVRARRVPLETFEFVGYLPGVNIYFVRSALPPGIRDASDLMKAKSLVAGGLGVEVSKDILIRLTLDMLNIPYKYVTGYKGSQGARLALETGEMDFFSESAPTYRTSIEPKVAAGELVTVFYDPQYDGINFKAPGEVAGMNVRSFPELYRTLRQKEPEGPAWEAYKTVVSLSTSLQRLIVFPPGAPKQAVVEVREAIRQMVVNSDYRDEAEKLFRFVPEIVSDDNVGETVKRALNVPPHIREWVAKYVANPPR